MQVPKMEPVPRPEWASPIEVGTHVKSFYSALPEQPTREVLDALREDSRVLGLFAQRALGRLEFSGRLPSLDWNGSYDRLTQDLVVNAFRSPKTYGKEFSDPGLANVSEAGRNLAEAMQRSLYHEVGHHILQMAGPEAERQAARLLRSGKAFPISRRAAQRGSEYFSETFSAYRFEDALADKDPEGYHMIEAILRTVGRK
jgi:hypothetical protein